MEGAAQDDYRTKMLHEIEVRLKKLDRIEQTMRDEAITVWKDGTWKRQPKTNAAFAQNDPDWLCTIPLTE